MFKDDMKMKESPIMLKSTIGMEPNPPRTTYRTPISIIFQSAPYPILALSAVRVLDTCLCTPFDCVLFLHLMPPKAQRCQRRQPHIPDRCRRSSLVACTHTI